MGWAHGIDRHGRDVGYAVKARCDEEGCTRTIDRGLGYVCGGDPDGGEHGCGMHFCYPHLYMPGDRRDVETPSQLCEACLIVWKGQE